MVVNTPMKKHKVGDTVTVKVNREFVEAVYDGWSNQYNMAMVLYNEKRIPRKVYEIVGGQPSGKPAPPVRQSRFDVDRRFYFIAKIVDMVITGESKSVIVSGSGGLGKTYTVMECLQAANLTNVDDFEENEGAEELDIQQEILGDFVVIKGFSTPKALYRLLWTHKDRIIVFDDCDSIWRDDVSVSLLKCALDSYDTRRIHWHSEIRDDSDLPQSFEFCGKVIFVSNLSLTQLDQAVLSRCLYVDVTMTPAEKIQRITTVLPNIRPDMTDDMKTESLDLLREHQEIIGDLNIRTMLKVLEIRHAHSNAVCPKCGSKSVSVPVPEEPDRKLYECLEDGCKRKFKRTEAFGDWRDIAEYVITAL